MGFAPKWTKEEDELLKISYQKTKKEIIALFPQRTYIAVKLRAQFLGLRKERNEYVDGKCDILLEDIPLAYYWMGFILADGHITKLYRLAVTLSYIDELHLLKLSNLLQVKMIKIKNDKFVHFKVQDRYVFSKICDKFGIVSNKTENPPLNLPNSNPDLLISLFAGLIDGDGCIQFQSGRNDCALSFHCHKSWINYYNLLIVELEKIFNITLRRAYIGSDGYLSWTCSNHHFLFALKRKVYELNLPVMFRKWDKIDLNRKFRTDNQKWKQIIDEYMKNPLQKYCDIAKKCNCSDSFVSTTIRKILSVEYRRLPCL